MSLLSQEKPSAAIKEFTAAIALAPRSADAYAKRARAYEDLERHKEALADAEASLKLAENPVAYQIKGYVAWDLQKMDEAVAYFQHAERLDRHDSATYIQLSRLHAQMGQPKAALSDCDRGIRAIPDAADIYLQRAAILKEASDIKEAIADMDKSIQLEPTAQAYVDRAYAHWDLDQPNEALADIAQASKLFHHDAAMFLQLAELHAYGGKDELAVQDCLSGLRLDPNSAALYIRLGQSYSEIGATKNALAAISKSILLKPTAEAFSARGFVHWDKQEREAALADFTRASKLDPKDEDTYWHIARIYAEQKKYNLAEMSLNAAIKENPSSSSAYCKRGHYFAERGNRHKALRDHDLALKCDPKDAYAFNSRGLVYLTFKDYKSAEQDLRKAMQLDWDSKFTANLGATLVFMRRYREAVELLAKASDKFPNSAEIHNNLGVAYQALNMHEQAKAAFQRALSHGGSLNAYFSNHALVSLKTGDIDEALGDLIAATDSGTTKHQTKFPVDMNKFNIVVEEYSKTIALNPNDATNYYNRGIANYCLERFEDSASDFSNFIRLCQWNGDSRTYGAIMLAMSCWNLKQEARAFSVLQTEKLKAPPHTWIIELIDSVKAGKAALGLFDDHVNAKRQLAARCFMGLRLLNIKQVQAGKKHLLWVYEHADAHMDERSLAASALLKIGEILPSDEDFGISSLKSIGNQDKGSRLIVEY